MRDAFETIGVLYVVVCVTMLPVAYVRTVRAGGRFDMPHIVQTLGFAGLFVWIPIAFVAVSRLMALPFRRAASLSDSVSDKGVLLWCLLSVSVAVLAISAFVIRGRRGRLRTAVQTTPRAE